MRTSDGSEQGEQPRSAGEVAARACLTAALGVLGRVAEEFERHVGADLPMHVERQRLWAIDLREFERVLTGYPPVASVGTPTR